MLEELGRSWTCVHLQPVPLEGDREEAKSRSQGALRGPVVVWTHGGVRGGDVCAWWAKAHVDGSFCAVCGGSGMQHDMASLSTAPRSPLVFMDVSIPGR